VIQLAIILFMFMAAIDTSVLATITPYIISSVGEMHLYPMMSAAFLFAFVIGTPVVGMCADHYGCKRTSYGSLILFLIGSLMCGLSSSMKMLIVFRFIQGVGAAGLTNICFIIIGRLYQTDAKRSFMQAILSAVWASASIFGPLLGAFLTIAYSWRVVFFLNIPIGIIAIRLLSKYKENHQEIEGKVDLSGAILFTIAVLFTFISASSMADVGFSLGEGFLFMIGIGAFMLFIFRSLKSESPIIPLRLLKNKMIAICIFLGLISGACLTCASTLISMYLQGAVRQSLQHTGFVIAAMSVGWTAGSFGCGFLLRTNSIGRVSFLALMILLLGFCLYCGSSVDYSLTYFLFSSVVVGFGMGVIVNSTNTGVMQAAEHAMLGRATSFLGLVRSLGMSIGASIGGFMQLNYFQSYIKFAMKGNLSTATGDLLLARPEKFLEADFVTSVNALEFTNICQLFGRSIEAVFIWPVLILFLVSPLCLFIPRKLDSKTAVN